MGVSRHFCLFSQLGIEKRSTPT